MGTFDPEKQNELFDPEVTDQARMYHAIAEMGELGVLVLNEENRIEFANRKVSNITGFKTDNLLGSNFTDLLVAENRKSFLSLKKKHKKYSGSLNRKTEQKTSREFEINTASSTPLLTEMCFANYSMPRAGKEKCIVYIRDMSVQKKLTRELQESERRRRNLFERIDQGICITTKEGRFLDCNQAMLKLLGYESKEEFLKIDINKDLYTNIEDRKKFQELIERDGHVKNYEVEYKKKNGEKIPVLMTSHIRENESGEVIGYQGLVMDISERIRIEQELREKHGFLTNLLESSADCIVVSDMKGNIIFFNRAAEKLTGYREEEVAGKLHITKLYPLEAAKNVMRKLRSKDFGGRGKVEKLMHTIYGKNNEEIPVSLSASIVYEGEQELATLGIFTDLRDKIKTEKDLKDAQVRLLQSEKMASIGSLAAGVAHEINNPLGGIIIFASLLMEDFEDEKDPRLEDLKKIVEEATRCKDIVKNLLEFGRQTESKFEAVDINKALIDVLFFLENQVLFHDIHINKHLDFSLPLCQGDPNQIKQIFMNMIVNAAEAMSPGGGDLTITTGTSSDRSTLFVSFRDTGTGIPPEIQSKIFDPFFTTKEVGKGTGLGLSTSYGIIQSHHGIIDVESTPEKGTTFIISLPVSAQECP